jgi:phosphotransferase system enzyme I (PtsI)
MEVIQGIPASPGIAAAVAFLLESGEYCVPRRKIPEGTEEAEVARIHGAVEEAAKRLEALRERVHGSTAEVDGVLGAHLAILRDPALAGQAEKLLRTKGWAPEWALSSVLDAHAEALLSSGDEYLAHRVADLRDIKHRILRVLLGHREEELARQAGTVVIVARDLTPTQTAGLDRRKVSAIVLEGGGPTSHTAIIARSLGIPAVVGAAGAAATVLPGMKVIVDGSRGRVVLDPDRATLLRFEEIGASYAQRRAEVERARKLPAETRDGHRVRVLANVEFPSEIPAALEAGAEGIGLFRTEFLVRSGGPLPSEADHLRAYREGLALLDGRPMVIRTYDLGADKLNPDLAGEKEPNPFLGRRSLRLCLERMDIFVPQVRAILRASAFGDVRVLLPMVGSVGEFLRAKEVFDSERARLRREGAHPAAELPLGVMVEVPAAAISADVLARHAAFFSIGTNDLIQYTLAVDRVNPRVASLFEPTHPAVLRLITRVIQAARAEGIEVSICGEMSGEPLYSYLLLGLGVRVLSMGPPSIPEVKQVIRSGTMEDASALADEVRGLSDGREILAHVRRRMRELVPVLF